MCETGSGVLRGSAREVGAGDIGTPRYANGVAHSIDPGRCDAEDRSIRGIVVRDLLGVVAKCWETVGSCRQSHPGNLDSFQSWIGCARGALCD